MTIGKKIQEKRLEKKFTQEMLAELADVCCRTIQDAEADKVDLRWSTIKAIAKALNINLGELNICLNDSEIIHL